jgi:PH (Pleckstrin Homology) domain-containing protein
MQRVRFRPHQAILVAAVFGFIGALPLVFGPDSPTAVLDPGRPAGGSTVRWVLLPILLVPIAVFVWALRAGTDADSEGLRVRALFGQRRVPWREVRELAADPRGRGVALLTDGHAVTLPQVRAADLPRLVAASGRTIDDPGADRGQ